MRSLSSSRDPPSLSLLRVRTESGLEGTPGTRARSCKRGRARFNLLMRLGSQADEDDGNAVMCREHRAFGSNVKIGWVVTVGLRRFRDYFASSWAKVFGRLSNGRTEGSFEYCGVILFLQGSNELSGGSSTILVLRRCRKEEITVMLCNILYVVL